MAWVMLLGLGAYLAYVPFGSVLFDRLIASTRVAGTAVFAISVADALGYVGSVAVQLYRDLAESGASRAEFLARLAYFMSALGIVTLSGSGWYFWRRTGEAESELAARAGEAPPIVGDTLPSALADGATIAPAPGSPLT
jgi:hypothetical protein